MSIHTYMAEYTRRGLGTAFVSILCFIEIVFAVVISKILYENEYGYFHIFNWIIIAFDLNLLYKLGFHLWMLVNPKVSTDALKLNIFFGGSVALSVLTSILALYEAIMIDSILSNIYVRLLIMISPGLFAIGERFIYGLPEDSESCFKSWKPWSVSTNEYYKA